MTRDLRDLLGHTGQKNTTPYGDGSSGTTPQTHRGVNVNGITALQDNKPIGSTQAKTSGGEERFVQVVPAIDAVKGVSPKTVELVPYNVDEAYDPIDGIRSHCFTNKIDSNLIAKYIITSIMLVDSGRDLVDEVITNEINLGMATLHAAGNISNLVKIKSYEKEHTDLFGMLRLSTLEDKYINAIVNLVNNIKTAITVEVTESKGGKDLLTVSKIENLLFFTDLNVWKELEQVKRQTVVTPEMGLFTVAVLKTAGIDPMVTDTYMVSPYSNVVILYSRVGDTTYLTPVPNNKLAML